MDIIMTKIVTRIMTTITIIDKPVNKPGSCLDTAKRQRQITTAAKQRAVKRKSAFQRTVPLKPSVVAVRRFVVVHPLTI